MGERNEDLILRVEGLCKRYGETVVLDHLNIAVRRGEKIVLIGPSGTGKSTLLRCIDLIEPVNEGLVFLDGQLVNATENQNCYKQKKLRHTTDARKKMGMVFQHFNLFPHMTVLKNLMEGPVKVLGLPKKSVRNKAIELLRQIGVEDKQNAYPSELSGGQQQRVAIMRAIAMDPILMLFDEVTSALDPQLVQSVLDLMKDLGNRGMTMLIVTHELGFAKDIADRVAFVDEGTVIEDGSPSRIFTEPSHERTKHFLKSLLERSAATGTNEPNQISTDHKKEG